MSSVNERSPLVELVRDTRHEIYLYSNCKTLIAISKTCKTLHAELNEDFFKRYVKNHKFSSFMDLLPSFQFEAILLSKCSSFYKLFSYYFLSSEDLLSSTEQKRIEPFFEDAARQTFPHLKEKIEGDIKDLTTKASLADNRLRNRPSYVSSIEKDMDETQDCIVSLTVKLREELKVESSAVYDANPINLVWMKLQKERGAVYVIEQKKRYEALCKSVEIIQDKDLLGLDEKLHLFLRQRNNEIAYSNSGQASLMRQSMTFHDLNASIMGKKLDFFPNKKTNSNSTNLNTSFSLHSSNKAPTFPPAQFGSNEPNKKGFAFSFTGEDKGSDKGVSNSTPPASFSFNFSASSNLKASESNLNSSNNSSTPTSFSFNFSSGSTFSGNNNTTQLNRNESKRGATKTPNKSAQKLKTQISAETPTFAPSVNFTEQPDTGFELYLNASKVIFKQFSVVKAQYIYFRRIEKAKSLFFSEKELNEISFKLEELKKEPRKEQIEKFSEVFSKHTDKKILDTQTIKQAISSFKEGLPQDVSQLFWSNLATLCEKQGKPEWAIENFDSNISTAFIVLYDAEKEMEINLFGSKEEKKIGSIQNLYNLSTRIFPGFYYGDTEKIMENIKKTANL